MRLLIAAFLLSLTAAAPVWAEPAEGRSNNCFVSSNWHGWSAPGESNVIYLRVGLHDYFRVELTEGTHVRRSYDRFLVNDVRGSGWICSALDLNLTLADNYGYQQPLIARSLRKLTPEEVTAMPEGDLPG
jgi:hypothetical protein